MKNLLENFAELRDTGIDNGFRKDFHKFARESHHLDTSVLEVKGSELESSTLKGLASQLKELTLDHIKDLNAKVNDLKKEQSKGPKTQKDDVKTPEPHVPQERTASIPPL